MKGVRKTLILLLVFTLLFGSTVSSYADGPKNLNPLENIFKEAVLEITHNNDDKTTVTVPSGSSISDLELDLNDIKTIRIHYFWEMSDGLDLEEGDYASIQVPGLFEYNGPLSAMTGDLFDANDTPVGVYALDSTNLLTLTFNDELVGLDDRGGDVWLLYKLDASAFEDNVIQEVDFGINGETFNIVVRPDDSVQSLTKAGAADNTTNTKEIYWSVDVNKSLDELENAILTDPTPVGLQLVESSFEIYELVVGINGDATDGAEVTSDYTVQFVDGGYKIVFGNISKAYRIYYTTEVVDFKEEYTNTATLSADNFSDDIDASFPVGGLETSVPLEKSGLANAEVDATKITWTIDVNKAGVSLTEAIVDDTIPTGLILDADSIKVNHLVLNSDGTWSVGGALTGPFSSFPITLGEIDSAYRIEYDTLIDNTEYFESETFVNTAELYDGEDELATDPATVVVTRSPLFTKAGEELVRDNAGYINWTINVNEVGIEITDAIIEDVLGPNLEIDPASFEVKRGSTTLTPTTEATLGENEYRLTVNTAKDQFTIELGDIDAHHVITYRTKMTAYDADGYSNGAGLSGEGVPGETDADDTVKPTAANSYSKITSDDVTLNGKNYMTPNYSEQTISWQINVNAQKSKIEGFTIEDYFLPSMHYVAGSLEVTKNNDNTNLVTDLFNVTIEGEDGIEGLTITTKSGTLERGYYRFRFKTSFDPDAVLATTAGVLSPDGNYTNYATISGTEVDPWGAETALDTTKDATATLDETLVVDGGKKDGLIDRDNREIVWGIYVNALNQTITDDFIISDVLGDGQTIIEGSFGLWTYELSQVGAIVFDRVDDAVPITTGTLAINTDKTGFTYTFAGGIDKAYYLEFKTKIHGVSLEKYTNVATAAYGEVEKLYPGEVLYEDHDNFAVKSSDVEGGTAYTDDLINWSVVINDSLSEITNARVIDTISSGQIYVNDSLTLHGGVDGEGDPIEHILTLVDGSSPLQPFEYTVEIDTDGNTIIILALGDIDSSYSLAYQTVVMATTGTISNLVQLLGDEELSNNDDDLEYDATEASGGTGTGSTKRGSITLTKIDKATGLPIEDNPATFELFYLLNGVEVVMGDAVETDADGVYEFTNLSFRTYYLREVGAPNGYLLSDEVITVILPGSDGKKDIEIPYENVPAVDITVEKKWDGSPLAGEADFPPATFQLKQNGVEYEGPVTLDGTETTPWTYTWAALPDVDSAGDSYVYTIEEVDIPEGYVSLSMDGRVFTNAVIKGDFEITKSDFSTAEPLPETTISIYKKDGTLIGSKVTDKDGIATFENLEYGEYYFVETDAPVGYVLNTEEHPFKIEEDGKTVKATLENHLITGNFELSKTDFSTAAPLPDTTITVYKKDGTLVGSKVTDKDGKATFEKLDYGEYYFVETDAPVGYLLNTEEHPFKIEEDGKTVKATLENHLITGDFELSKSAFSTAEPLPNTKISVYRKDGTLVASKVTDKDGIALFEKLGYGEYYFVESEAPEGYQLNTEEHPFKIEEDGKTVKATLENHLITGTFELSKVDASTAAPLPKTKISVYKEDGTLVDTKVTDKDGKATFKDLPYGKYYFVESEAPEGYELNDAKHPFEIKENGKVVKATLENTKLKEEGLPSTGSDSMTGILLGGIALLAVGFILLRKKDKSKA